MKELFLLSETIYNNINKLLDLKLIENIKIIDIVITIIIINFIRKVMRV